MITDLQHQLGIDSSFFTQFVIFLVIFVWLQVVYFKPFLQLILKREGQSDGMTDDAAKLQEEAARLETQYEETISQARKKAYAEREALLTAARKEGSVLVADARAQAKSKLDKARETAAKSYETELNGLKGQVSSVSTMLVDKLMNMKVGL